ncbi:MAG: hypothetical protein JW843_13145 [Candidatus Aminicenantes bacterium]|nr:hypothetical protein [Candidatus Aminicenantes bacterium]
MRRRRPEFKSRGVVAAAALFFASLVFWAGPVRAGQTQPPLPGEKLDGPREGTYLYRFMMLQAGPGRLADLIELFRNRAPVIVAGGDEKPYIVRHSQGDHWDILVIQPYGSMSDYYSRERIAKRDAAAAAAGLPSDEFARLLKEMLLWHEDLYVLGPPVGVFREFVKEAGLAHFEMIRSLPGKFDALVEERRMENAFNRERGRGQTLIFTRDQGADWDVVTLGVYRNWRQYAESELISREVSEAAARKAGFADAGSVGNYMRTLMSTHRDTLGPPVILADR